MHKGGIIYQIKNILNNKCYIGQTINSFNVRYESGKWWKKTTNRHLKYAAKKYGIKNFKVKILAIATNKKELNKFEKFYIKKLNSMEPNGYNIKTGGAHGVLPEASKKQISGKLKKYYSTHVPPIKKWSKEKRLLAAKRSAKARTGKTYPHMFKGPTPYTIERARQANKGRISVHRKKIIRNDGIIFTSVTEAAQKSNTTTQNIRRAIYKNHTAYGFGFKYYDGINNKLWTMNVIPALQEKRSIIRSDGKIYESISSAARDLKGSTGNISMVLKRTRHTHKGYSFNYLEDNNVNN